MAVPFKPGQTTFVSKPQAASLAFLLQRGLDHVQQGRSAEAATLFALVREQLSFSQTNLIDLLDAFLHEYADYAHIEHTLQEVSTRFAAAHLELQARMATFGTALSTMLKDALDVDGSSGLLQEEQEPDLSMLLPGVPTQHLQEISPSVTSPLITENSAPLAPLSITCFGHFEVRRLGKPITLCSNRSGQRILRFLISQLGRKATSDRLQAMLWPEDEIEVAARKLYLAISALRRSLSDDPSSEPSHSYIVCKNRVYALNASVAIQTDVDEFLHCYHTGQRGAAERVTLYEKACQLYTGPFLAEDLYADWSFIQREQLTRAYLTMRNELTDYYLKAGRYEEAAQSAHAVLKENRCDEAAHRHLIQVYIAQGRRSEALQQYARCTSVLHEELGVKPLPETTLAIQALLTNDFPSTQQYRKNIEKT